MSSGGRRPLRWAAVAVVAAFAMVGVAGCANGSGGLATLGSTARTTVPTSTTLGIGDLQRVDVDQWADDSCASEHQLLNTLTVPDFGDTSDTEAVKAKLVAYLHKVRRGTERFLAGIQDAGVPKIPQGELIVGDLLTQTQTLVELMRRDEAKAKAVDGSDASAVVAVLQSTAKDFDRIGNIFGSILGNLPDKYPKGGEYVNDAYHDSLECQALNEATNSDTGADTGTDTSAPTTKAPSTTTPHAGQTTTTAAAT